MVTGATGFIGNRLVQELLNSGYQVNVLVRSKNRIPAEQQKQVSIFEGDLFDLEMIDAAMKSCEFVFHLAAYANIWSKEKNLAYKTNVTGTRNILDTALKNGISKVVFTSSAATLSPSSEANEEMDENSPVPEKYSTDYETTKREAELLCLEYVGKGLKVVTVKPPRVYGPGKMSKSNSVTLMIKLYMKGTWRFIPGTGEQIGNYAFIDDVVKGHILALQKGTPGETYIVGGTNASYNLFFKTLREVSGKNYRMVHLPFSLMLAISKFELFMAETVGKKPLITPPWIRRYLQDRLVSSGKAMREIGYTITPLRDGISKTIVWLHSK